MSMVHVFGEGETTKSGRMCDMFPFFIHVGEERFAGQRKNGRKIGASGGVEFVAFLALRSGCSDDLVDACGLLQVSLMLAFSNHCIYVPMRSQTTTKNKKVQ